jgi:hypothetical protein
MRGKNSNTTAGAGGVLVQAFWRLQKQLRRSGEPSPNWICAGLIVPLGSLKLPFYMNFQKTL